MRKYGNMVRSRKKKNIFSEGKRYGRGNMSRGEDQVRSLPYSREVAHKLGIHNLGNTLYSSTVRKKFYHDKPITEKLRYRSQWNCFIRLLKKINTYFNKIMLF